MVSMDVARIWRHWLTTQGRVRRCFPAKTLAAITQAIEASELTHAGELRFAVEGSLDGAPLFKGQSARERALELFSQARVWDTEHNNGVLIYLLLADRAVEIVADRGFRGKVPDEAWGEICRQMEASFRRADFAGGVEEGVRAVTRHMALHFPARSGDTDELPNQPLVL
jgi:hypothetical protein